MDIKIGDKILANGQTFVVTGKPYIPDAEELHDDDAIDETYKVGEYVIPVDNASAIYESEVDKICE